MPQTNSSRPLRHGALLGAALVLAGALGMLFAVAPGSWFWPGGTKSPEPAEGAPLAAAQGRARARPLEAAGRVDEPGREAVPGRGGLVSGVVRWVEGGAPLPGVEVLALDRPAAFARIEVELLDLLRRGFYAERREPPAPAVLGRGRTDANGRFTLRGLPPGRLWFALDGAPAYLRAPRAVTLQPREERRGVTLLASRGAILSGEVRDPAGRPAAGARVVLRPGANAFLSQLLAGRWRWYETRTRRDGSFRFAGVPAGRGYAVTALPAGAAPASRRELALTKGRELRVVLRAEPGVAIAGRVLDPAGRPVAGALVGFVYLDLARALFSLGPGNPVRSDREGYFRLAPLGRGWVGVAAHAPGMAPSPPRKVFVGPGGLQGLELSLAAGARLAGRVEDGAGRPLAGVSVTARPLDTPRPFEIAYLLKLVRHAAVTDPDGRFTLAGLAGERVFVEAAKPGYLPARVRHRRRGGRWPELVLRLERGHRLAGFVRDPKGRPVTRFVISARSARERRLPIGPEWGRPPRRSNPYTDASPWRRAGQEVSNAEGRFSAGPFPAGEVRYRVLAEGFVPAEGRVRLPLAEPITVTLEPGGTIEGRVTAAGRPVAEAQVTWRRARAPRGPAFLPFRIEAEPEDLDVLSLSSVLDRRSVLTDLEGRFRLTGVAPGAVRVTARHPDYAKASTRVTAAAGRTARVELVLDTGGSLAGRVLDARDRPLAGASVVAVSIAKGVLKGAVSDAQGRYRITALAPGPYLVAKVEADATRPDFLAGLLAGLRLKSALVRAGRTTRLDLRDRSAAGVDLFGRVTFGERPLPGAVVTLLGKDPEGPLGVGFRTATSGPDGSYELKSVPPGRYLVRLTRFTRGRPHGAGLDLEVPAGRRRLRVDLAFPAGVLSGRVVDAAGRPLAGVRLRAVPDARRTPGGLVGLLAGLGGRARSRSGRDGRFELDRLAPGRWWIRAEVRGAAAARAGDAEFGPYELAAGERRSGLVLALPAAALFAARVVDGLGHPVAGARVRLWPVEEPQAPGPKGEGEAARLARRLRAGLRRSGRTDRAGRVRISGVPPGLWRAGVEHRDLVEAEPVTLRLAPGQRAETVLHVVRGGRLRLRVVGRDGRVVPRGAVRVLDGRGREVGRASVLQALARLFRAGAAGRAAAESGWLDLGLLRPDEYTLEVRLEDGGRPVVRRVVRRLHEGERASWELTWRELTGR